MHLLHLSLIVFLTLSAFLSATTFLFVFPFFVLCVELKSYVYLAYPTPRLVELVTMVTLSPCDVMIKIACTLESNRMWP